ncbi:hypothetical protein SAMD00079811_69250 [Scytonema sp. HK-05]|uniref:hypothetical protein n=1 Tax=Scytonema sp. HK-05 TaxID=1137095 RepID=UPI000AAA821E|nr:hypothetical protein [Scytonema sp. HK-05]BAY49296.1 hypothetical protein SAMD00079811_69250 [Scytonema sp. HK-05]
MVSKIDLLPLTKQVERFHGTISLFQVQSIQRSQHLEEILQNIIINKQFAKFCC